MYDVETEIRKLTVINSKARIAKVHALVGYLWRLNDIPFCKEHKGDYETRRRFIVNFHILQNLL